MNVTIGLDVSTAVVGIVVLDESESIVFLEAIDLRKLHGEWSKLDKVEHDFANMGLRLSVTQRDVKKIFVERNLQGFRPGFSSAETLMALARFNGMVSSGARRIFEADPTYVDVNAARKALGIRVPKPSRDKSVPKPDTKLMIFEQVSKLIQHNWIYKTLSSGPRKGQTILDDCNFDMCDAWITAKAGLLLEKMTPHEP